MANDAAVHARINGTQADRHRRHPEGDVRETHTINDECLALTRYVENDRYPDLCDNGNIQSITRPPVKWDANIIADGYVKRTEIQRKTKPAPPCNLVLYTANVKSTVDGPAGKHASRAST